MRNATLFMISILIIFGCLNSAFAQPPQHTYDLRMIVTHHDYSPGGFFDVKIEIISDGSSPFIMGDANLVFEYNSQGLSTPTSFTAHNFSGGGYAQMTVTTPNPQGTPAVSVNIVLNSAGTTVVSSWTPVVTIRFTIVDHVQYSNIVWRTASPNPTLVYDEQSQLIPADDLNDLNVVLPVELTSFTANAIDGQVGLNWTTQTETNNLGFDIERSVDENEFLKIGFVKGNGTTILPQNYSFKDQNLAADTYYYRLKQIDLDGSFNYSEVITTLVEAPKEFSLAQNYPNPFNPSTTIRYELPLTSHVVLKIYNILGEEVRSLVDEEQAAGVRTIVWDSKNNTGESVSSGHYYYRLVTGDFSRTLTLMLMR